MVQVGLVVAILSSSSALHIHQTDSLDSGVAGNHDLVFVHTPYNFGHTVENSVMFGPEVTYSEKQEFIQSMGGFATSKEGGASWDHVNKIKAPDGEVWGHNNPDLQGNSSVGCPYYYTPQKYWPKDLAENYFGAKKVFGVLRDPYEHLVALFRGQIKGYGGDGSSDFQTCDINNAIKKQMKAYIAGDRYMSGCTLVPQAEYFNGEYGISIPIDNRKFPDNLNEIFKEHGYSTLHIKSEDVIHVTGCQNAWAADFDVETKGLVRQVYKRDFELLCKHFGYCDDQEDTCLTRIPGMCPLTHYQWVEDPASGVMGGRYAKKEQPSPPTPEELKANKKAMAAQGPHPLDVRGVGERFVAYEKACDSECEGNVQYFNKNLAR